MKMAEYMEALSRAQIAILGPGRAGKTSLAYSVSQLGKTLGIESEEGVQSAIEYINADNLEIETVTRKIKDASGRWVPMKEQPSIRERLDNLVKIAYTGGYEFVVVDSLTDIAGHFVDEYARQSGMVSQADWFKLIAGIKKFVRDLKNGDFHLITTCISSPPKEKSLIEVAPSLPGSLREDLLPMFQSIILLTYDKKNKTRKLVVNDPGRGVCDRFHAFGDVMEVDITGDPGGAMKTMIDAVRSVRDQYVKPKQTAKIKRATRGGVRRVAVNS